MNIGERYQYWAPWTLTGSGLTGKPFRRQTGGDEWHNQSWMVNIPLVGMFVWFPKAGFDRTGREHIYAIGPSGTVHGRIVDGCATCTELLAEHAAWRWPEQTDDAELIEVMSRYPPEVRRALLVKLEEMRCRLDEDPT